MAAYGEMTPFVRTKAFLDTIRYEEVERLFHEVLQYQRTAPDVYAVDGFWHKHASRELTSIEVYQKALEDVMNILDERMGVLSAQ